MSAGKETPPREDLFNQILALPFISACSHTQPAPTCVLCENPDNENADDSDSFCECGYYSAKNAHEPYDCPDIPKKYWYEFAKHPAVIALIGRYCEELDRRNFTLKKAFNQFGEIKFRYSDPFGNYHAAEITLDVDEWQVYLEYCCVETWRGDEIDYECLFDNESRAWAEAYDREAKIIAERDALRDEVIALRAENAALKLQIEYQPDGPGYERAHEHFSTLKFE